MGKIGAKRGFCEDLSWLRCARKGIQALATTASAFVYHRHILTKKVPIRGRETRKCIYNREHRGAGPGAGQKSSPMFVRGILPRVGVSSALKKCVLFSSFSQGLGHTPRQPPRSTPELPREDQMTELADTFGMSLNLGLKMSPLNAETEDHGDAASALMNLTTQLWSNRPGAYAIGTPKRSWEGFLEEMTSWTQEAWG